MVGLAGGWQSSGPRLIPANLVGSQGGGVTSGTQGASRLSGLLLQRRLGLEGMVTSHKTGRSRGGHCSGSRAATGALEFRGPVWREGSACHGCFLDMCLCGQTR